MFLDQLSMCDSSTCLDTTCRCPVCGLYAAFLFFSPVNQIRHWPGQFLMDQTPGCDPSWGRSSLDPEVEKTQQPEREGKTKWCRVDRPKELFVT